MVKVDDEEEWGERKGQVSHERGKEIGRSSGFREKGDCRPIFLYDVPARHKSHRPSLSQSRNSADKLSLFNNSQDVLLLVSFVINVDYLRRDVG